MNKFYLFFISVSLLFFSACSSKSALNYFKSDPQSAMAIQYTKKSDLIYKNDINAVIFSTYLNKINSKYENGKLDSFIIGTHLVNKNNHDFIANGYKIFLNDKLFKSIKGLDKQSDLVKSIPLKNNWANYYIIHFNRDKNRELILKLIHPIYGQTQVKFQK